MTLSDFFWFTQAPAKILKFCPAQGTEWISSPQISQKQDGKQQSATSPVAKWTVQLTHEGI